MNLATRTAAISLSLGLLSGLTSAKDVSIAFADHGGIKDWQADHDLGIWIQDSHRKWYYARFMSPCHELRFAEGVGFVTGPGGQLDRFSSVKVRGEARCVFTSFDESAGPPKPKKKQKSSAPAAASAPQAAPPPAAPDAKP
jgi:hypothetical protein